MPTLQRKLPAGRRISAQTTISPAFQTTLAAEAVRALGLRPGMILSQTVEGNRLILEPLHDVNSLAGSLGTGRPPVSIEKMKQGAKAAMAQAARRLCARIDRMKSVAIDANVIVRYLTGDDPVQSPAATELFRAASAGRLNVILPTSVLQETVYALETFYHGTPETIAPKAHVASKPEWCHVPGRPAG